MCPGLGIVKEGKQHLVETRPSTLASVNDQEQRGGGIGLEPPPNFLSKRTWPASLL